MIQQFISLKGPIVFVLLILFSKLAIAQHKHPEQPVADTPQNPYLIMMDSMMLQMHQGPTANSMEAEFIRQMIPHHQGAIAMTQYEINHGRDRSMVQLAKSILVEQTVELQKMDLWLKQTSSCNEKLPGKFEEALNQSMTVMMQNMTDLALIVHTDLAFAKTMIPHHQAAIDMAKVLLTYSQHKQLCAFATQLISSQQIEIAQLSSLNSTPHENP